MWHDDLQLYLLSDSKDSVSLFDHVSGAAPAPPATANVSTRSQWLSRDATARLVIRNHLPATECAHFGKHRTAQALYDAVVARYSSPTTAAIGRLLLPYLFPELSAFATVADLVTHLRTSDARYRATDPAEFLPTNQPPMFITLYFIVTRLPDSLRSVRTSVLLCLLRSATTARARVDTVVEEATVVVEVAVGAVVGAAVDEVQAVEVVAADGPVAAVEALVAAVEAAEGVAAVEAVGPVMVGLDLSVEALVVVGASSSSVGARLRRPSSSVSGWFSVGRVRVVRPARMSFARFLQSEVAIFDLDFDVIISAMYALSFSAEGGCFRCMPPDPGIAAAALGARASCTPPGTAPAEALHTFTLDSGASRCSFGLHLPSFSTNLVSTAVLQDAMVTTTTTGGQRVSICTCTRTGRHLATFTRRPGSSLYTLATEPPQVASSAHMSASRQVAASCLCRLLSHQTLLWHHCLGHPSLPRLRGMHSRLLVSGLPRSLPPLTPSPAPPCLPCVEGRQRAVPHSSSFPPTTAPLQTLHMDVKDEVSAVLIPWIRTVRLKLRERFGQDLPVLRLHSDRGGEFSSDLLRDFCRGEGITQSFTLPDSPQQNRSAERRIGLIMEVARTSMIHAAAPHFLWTFAVRYAAHQLNLWPRVSLPETSPTLRWTGKVGDASVFRVWGSRAFVRDMSADKLSACAIPCVFLGFVLDAPGWQFYHPTSHRVLPSQDVTFDKLVPFYRLFPYHFAPPPPPPLFLAPGPPPVDPLPPKGPAPSGVSQVDPLPGTALVPVAVVSGAAPGAASGGAASGGVEPGGAGFEGAGSGGAEPEGVEPGGAESEGAESGGAEPRGAASSRGPGGASPRLSSQQQREWLLQRADRRSGAPGAGEPGDPGAGGADVTSGAGDPTEPGAAGARGAGADVAGVGGPRVGGAGVAGAGAVDPGAGGANGTPASPLPVPSPYTEKSGGLTERREPASRPVSPVRTARRAPRSRPPPVPGTHTMTLRPSSVPLRVPLPAPPESSLLEVPDPESDRARAASPTVARLLAAAVTDPPFESTAASALCALGTDVLEHRQEDFECLAASVPRFASMLLALEGDPDAPDIPTPRCYAEAITGTQWSLRRPVYGLRQAPRAWHDTLRTTLAALGFAPSITDPSLFLRTDTSLPLFYVLVYVDDLVFATADTEALTLVKSKLQKRHTCIDLGELRSYLGLQITWDRARRTITLTQSHMVHQVLQRFGFLYSLPQLFVYQPLALSSTFGRVRRAEWHQKVHWDAAKRVLRYLCSTSGMGLVLGGRGPVVLTGHADASWVDDSATQRSSQGYTFSLAGRGVAQRSGSGGGQRQQQQRSRETPSPQQLREWYAGRQRGGGTGPCTYVLRTGDRVGEQCGGLHSTQRCFGRLTDSWRHQFPDATEIPRWGDLSRAGVAIFDLDYDAILAAMYALSTSDEGDCYLCVPLDSGIEAAALGAGETAALGASASAAPGTGESAPSGTASAQVFHTFTLDSGASRSFFRDRTTLTPLSRPVAVSLADPSRGPVLASFSTVLPCPEAPSGSLSGLYLPSFSTNLVTGADLQDQGVDQFTPASQRVTHCTCARTGRHLATFSRRPGSSLYTLSTESPPVSASGQVAASSQTLLWHHRLGHPSLPRLRGMASRVLVSGLPRSLPPLPPGPVPTCVPCVEGRQRAAPHSSEFPPTEALLQTLHMNVWGPARVRGQGHERYFLLVVDDYSRYTTVFPLRSKGEVAETFTLPASPQQNGIAERRIGMVMDVTRTSMIHAAAPHFLWPFAVQYAAHQLNLQPRVSLPETSPTLLWTGKVGDASAFRVWGSRAFVRDLSADKLFPRATPCVFLGFPPDAPGWQFYHPTSRRVLSSQDVTFDESGPAPSGVSQVDAVEPVEVAVDSGAAPGAEPAGAGSGGAEPEGAEPGGAESGGAGPWGAESGGAESVGAEPEGTEPGGAEPGGAGSARVASRSASSRRELLSPQELREWFARRWSRAAGAGGTTAAAGSMGTCPGGAEGAGPGGAAEAAGVDPTGGSAGASSSIGAACSAETGAAGAAGAGATGGAGGSTGAGTSAGAGVGAAGAGGIAGAGAAAGSPGAVPAGPGGTTRPRPYFVPLLEQVLGLPPSPGPPPPLECPRPVQSQSQLQPVSPLPAPSPYTGPTGGLAERRAPVSHPASPARTASTSRRTSRPRPPAVPGTHQMVLRPSTAPLRVPLPSSPASSLPILADPASDSLHAVSPTVARLLAAVVTDPSLESTAASALVTELVDFAARCRLDYAASLVAESESVCPPSVGDPDAPDIPTPRSYAKVIEGPYSSQWQAAMDAEMASWKSTGTYVDEVPPPGANIVSGMWIFRVKRPPGSPPVFKARYVARGFSQRQGVDYFQSFSPTPQMTTLRVVLLHLAAQRDYELHSLDFSTAFLQGSLHEEIWLRRPPGFTGTFPPGTQWSLRRPVYGLRQAPREWHDTLRTTLAALGFVPSTADPSLFLCTDTSLPPFYILVYVDEKAMLKSRE
ncbi:unnamed protein product [Closterium sp. NIES-54]